MRVFCVLTAATIPAIVACSSGSEPSEGGNVGVGGSALTSTAGRAQALTAGSPSNLGGARNGSGGATANGGAKAEGGAEAEGGTKANGGAPSTGGNGGATASGGTNIGGISQGGSGKGGSATGGKASGGITAGGVGGALTGGASSGGANMAGANMAGANMGGASGAGTVPSCATNQISLCKGTNPITCDLGGGTGDYEVTMDLGGTTAGDMYIEAESHRLMLGPVKTTAGATKRFVFGVNVRQPEGQPVQNVPIGTPGLQLYVRGSAPKLSAVCAKPLSPKPKLWIAGDSTVCDQDGTDYAGWGQHLPQFFTVPVAIANYADSGESSSSVLNSAKMWGAIKAGWKSGDWVLVQVGHNDKDITANAFRSNMTAYVTQAKAAGVNIVLCTPISRVGYALASEHISSAGANLPQIIRDVAKAQDVPVIDLTVTTWNWLQTIDWKQYFALGTDRTHTNPAGAGVVAGFVRDAIRAQKLELANYLR